jgi:hypothetical protein
LTEARETVKAAIIVVPTMLMHALSATICGEGQMGQPTSGAPSARFGTALSTTRTGGAVLAEETLRWNGRAKSIEVRTMNAPVRAVPSADDQTHVVARVIRSDGAEPLYLRAIQKGAVTLICVESGPVEDDRDRSDEDQNDEPCGATARAGGAVTALDVRVAKGVKLASWTMNGSVDAEGLEGEVEAHTQNGAVRIETTGIARASTVNGSIRAKLGATSWDGTVTLETVNGQLEVELPKGVGGRLNADTVQGLVHVALPMNGAKVEDTHVEGQLGQGGGLMRLRTVNGRIDVR